MPRRAPSTVTQLLVITAIATATYVLLDSQIGTVAGYVAAAIWGVLVGLYLPIWTERAGTRARARTSWWGWWR